MNSWLKEAHNFVHVKSLDAQIANWNCGGFKSQQLEIAERQQTLSAGNSLINLVRRRLLN